MTNLSVRLVDRTEFIPTLMAEQPVLGTPVEMVLDRDHDRTA